MPEQKPLSPEQVLLVTLVVRLAVMAVLATMLARYRRFRGILIFERRDWPDRLVFVLFFGVPLAAGVTARLLLHYNAADLTLEASFLAGLIAGPYAGATIGALIGIPPLFAHEWIALPFAVGCGFAGGGLREICPKEAIWHFSPLFFTDLHRHMWKLVRRFQIDWVVILLAAPVGLEIIRQVLGAKFGETRIFFLAPPQDHPWFFMSECRGCQEWQGASAARGATGAGCHACAEALLAPLAPRGPLGTPGTHYNWGL